MSKPRRHAGALHTLGLSLIALSLMALSLAAARAGAESLAWDGRAVIALGLQQGAQAVLRLPEPLSGYIVDDPAALAVVSIDERTLAASPRTAAVDVRLIARGESGHLYVTRASTALRFSPVLEVEWPLPVEPPARRVAEAGPGRSVTPTAAGAELPRPMATLASPSSSSLDALGLMTRLMRGDVPNGFRVAPSSRLLLQTPEFRIDSEQVWSSPELVGIVALARRTTMASQRVRLTPERIEMQIPELGEFRVFGANQYLLDDATPATPVFLVFVRTWR